MRNTPGRLGLTPYEILYGGPPPLADVEVLEGWVNMVPKSLFAHLKALEVVRKEAWEQLKEAYQPEDPMITHKFQVGDVVLVRCHWAGSLEPHWKGRYLVLLTTPTAIKVDRIST